MPGSSGRLCLEIWRGRGVWQRVAIDGAGHEAIWRCTYRVQMARIYLYQGRNRDALALLETPVEAGAPVMVRVRWHTVRGLALDRTGDLPGAERELAEAKRMADAGPSGFGGGGDEAVMAR